MASQIVIATLEGDLVKINLDNYGVEYVSALHDGRVWKVSSSSVNNFVSTIGTDNKLCIFDVGLNQLVEKWEDKSFYTSCLYSEKNIFIANNDGEVANLNLSNISSRGIILNANKYTNCSRTNLKEEEDFINKLLKEHQNILFINCKDSMNKAYTERVLEILRELKVDFSLIDVTDKNGIKHLLYYKSGWSNFPQMYFNGKFIGAGSVLLEMHRTKALCRLIAEPVEA